MKLTTNLATRRYVNIKLLNLYLVIAMVILAAVLILRVREIAYNQAELGRVKGMLAGARSSSPGRKVTEADLKSLQGRVDFANAVIDRKAVDWLNLLDRLEEVLPSGVALNQIEPAKQPAQTVGGGASQQAQTVTIGGMASQFSSLRTLLENMEGSKNFSEVYLLSQTETKVGLTQRGIAFSISCRIAIR
jgi:type IV pilus assembly protein PilN